MPTTRERLRSSPPSTRVRNAAWIGSLGLHALALLLLTGVVVGVLQVDRAPPRLTVQQHPVPAEAQPLVSWAQPPTLDVPEPVVVPPPSPPLPLEEPPPPGPPPSGGSSRPAPYRAANAVRPLPKPATSAPPAEAPTPPTTTPPATVTQPTPPPAEPTPATPPAVVAATVRARATPSRPSRCRRRGHVGTVEVRLWVGVDGLPYHPKVVRSAGCKRLDEAAIAAVRRYRFHPATQAGLPVRSRERIVIHFRPRA